MNYQNGGTDTVEIETKVDGLQIDNKLVLYIDLFDATGNKKRNRNSPQLLTF